MKVFLSSTYQDLVEYRAKAAQAIERLGQQGIRLSASSTSHKKRRSLRSVFWSTTIIPGCLDIWSRNQGNQS
jgi:Domain of unknown function (DUF4062)